MAGLELSRRTVLAALGACGLAGGTGACSSTRTPATVPPPTSDGGVSTDLPAEELRLATRLSFGPTASLVAMAERGVDAFLDDQLDPTVPDTVELQALFDSVEARGQALAEAAEASEDPQAQRRRAAVETLGLRTVLRGAFSERQLHALLCDFWADHLHVSIREQPALFWLPAYDQEVIRTHATGSFAELLVASARSAAMLLYLDQATSRADGDNVPNENYAREVMELHTVGVDGGYDELDVVEAAHVLTGWSVERGTATFRYRSAWHDLGPLDAGGDVLGFRPSGAGEADGEDLLHHLARLPATARHVCHRLAVRLIGDHVATDDEIVTAASQEYLHEDSSIPAVVRVLVGSEDFRTAPPQTRRPLDLVLAALRMGFTPPAGEELDGLVAPVGRPLQALDQVPYGWPAPNGYPLGSQPWIGPGPMLVRSNVALALGNGVGTLVARPEAQLRDGVGPQDVAAALLGAPPSEALVAALDTLAATAMLGPNEAAAPAVAVRALTFASPDFQQR
jgi:uncharacterized protein (DUF1800 family)